MARKLFCQLSPFCYRISVEKEIMLRNLRDLISPVRFAEHREEKPLPALIKGHRSPMLRQLAGVDMQLQYNNRPERLSPRADHRGWATGSRDRRGTMSAGQSHPLDGSQ